MKRVHAGGASVAGFLKSGFIPPEILACLVNLADYSGYTADGAHALSLSR
jgi:hypothetical protein